MFLPVYKSLRTHEQCACVSELGVILTPWTESRANLVWHLWRPWDNLHDTATDRSRDIDLKSSSSKIRFLCVLIGPEAHTSVVIWAYEQSCVAIKYLTMESPTTPAVLTKVKLTTCGPMAWPPVPFLPPPCDNRDIPELVPCLAAGLSLNSSGVCGMLDFRAEQPGDWRQTDERKWTTLIIWGLLWLLVLEAPGCPQQDGPAHMYANRRAHTHISRENICHTMCKSAASQSICSCVVGLTKWIKGMDYMNLCDLLNMQIRHNQINVQLSVPEIKCQRTRKTEKKDSMRMFYLT